MHGLYLLWWVQEKHVPAPIVAALLGAGDLTIAALEIPTGWLADRYGHRVSLIAGSLVQVGGMLMCWLGEGVFGLLSAILLVAIGDACRSGADQALLYRSCVALDRESEFQRIESRARGIQLVALVLMTLAGGAIVARWGFAIGWLTEAAVCAVGLGIACAMIEPPAAVDASSDDGDAVTNGSRVAERSLVALPRAIFSLIIPAAILAGLESAISFVAQTTGGRGPTELSLLVALIALAEAAGAGVAAWLPATRASLVAIAATGIAAALATLGLPSAFLPVVVALSFLVGVIQPLRATAIQRLAGDEVRARAASIASACDRIVVTVALVAAASVGARWPRGRGRRA
jgi:hypothetical protein